MYARLLTASLLIALAACSSVPDRNIGKGSGAPGAFKVGQPYQAGGVTFYPKEDYSYDETGIASWYGPDFHGKRTANGETYDQDELTAAHPTLPMPSLVRVTNLDNGRSVVVRINDRGPFVPGRIIDVSKRGAQLLGFDKVGTAKVRVKIMEIESRAIADAARKRGYVAPPREVASAAWPVPTPGPEAGRVGGPPVETAPLETVDSTPLEAPAGVTEAPLAAPGEMAQDQSDQDQQDQDQQAQDQGSLPEVVGAPAKIEAAPVRTASASAPASKLVKTKWGGKTVYVQAPTKAPAQVKEPKFASIPGKEINGRFYPAPKVTHVKVTGGKRIFVQAGAFAQKANADRLKTKLGKLAPATVTQVTVKGKKFYRVRLGPIKTVQEADKILAKVIPQNDHARITVE
jgi:rare lipoprotein A